MIVFIEGRRINIREPSLATLKRYGLSLTEWKDIITRQGYRCPICKRPLEKTTNIEHLHVKNWKKYPANIRKLYVRGVTDWLCNHYYLGKGITLERAKNVVEYLDAFEKRRPK